MHEHATYLVDSLMESAPEILKDWNCMSAMLLLDGDSELDEKQEKVLVDLLVCAVKQTAEGVPPSGRRGFHKVKLKKIGC